MESPPAAFEPLRHGDPRLIGGYRVLARIGTGGTGRVFLATTQSGRRLAIKVVRPELAGDETFRARFQQDVAAAQRVQSPYVARVVDAHPAGPERPWIAGDHVPGPSLAHVLAVGGPLPTDAARALFAGLATGLAALHEAGLAHGALKPSAVLLAADGPRITDIGIDGAAATVRPGRAPLFTAPEQRAEGAAPSPAADVFALGAVVHFAATGRTAFGAASDAIMAAEISHDRPDLTGCPSALRGLIARCLAVVPADRPPLRAVLAELEQEPPGRGWLPAAVAAQLPPYEADPPAAEPAPLPDPAPNAATSAQHTSTPASPATLPDPAPHATAPGTRATAPGTRAAMPAANVTVPELVPEAASPASGSTATLGMPGKGSTQVLSPQDARPDILPPADPAPAPAYFPAAGPTTPDLPFMETVAMPRGDVRQGSNMVLLAAGGVLALAVAMCVVVALAFVL